MERVTGIGGIFFKSQDPKKLHEWYERHLGIKPMPGGGESATFEWRDTRDPEKTGMTVWSIFPHKTTYFGTNQSFMINYIVDDLGAVLKALKEEGVEIDKNEDSDYGRFAWVIDPEGNRIELWEPPKSA